MSYHTTTMRIPFILFIVLLISTNNTLAQDDICIEVATQLEEILGRFSRIKLEVVKQKVDSLSSIHAEDCEKATFLENTLYGRYQSKKGDIERALDYLNEANVYAIQKKDTYLKKRTLHYLALAEKERSNYTQSKVLWDSAYHIECDKEAIKCQKFNVALTINLAANYQSLGEPENALSKLYLAEKDIIKNAINDSMYKVTIYNTMGNLYDSEFSDLNNSILSYKKALQFVPKNHKAKYLLYNNIGHRYKDLSKPDSAKIFLLKTLKEANSSRYLITPYQSLADIELKNNNLIGARDHYTESITHAVKAKNPGMELYSRGSLAKTNYLLGDYNVAKKQFAEIFSKLKPGYFTETEIQVFKKYKYLIDVALKDENLSIELEKYFAKSDSLNSETKLAALEKSVSKYEKLILRDSLTKQVLLKENEEEKVKNYRLSTALLILSLLFLAGLAYQFRRLFRGQKQENEELVFQNSELQKVNQQLKKKTSFIASAVNKEEISPQLKVKSNDKIFMIAMDSIAYIQAEDDGTRIYHDNTSRWTDTPLKQIQGQISDSLFIQVFRSTLVNIKHIGWINSTTLKLKDDTILKIGRTYKQRIKEAIES